MIRSIDVRNFRCFRRLNVADCSRLNVIVGDNGAGKTALMEAIFLPLATSSEVGLRMRQQRGIDGAFQGEANKIERALWGSFFHNNDMNEPISLTLEGDGPESRSLEISRARSESSLKIGEYGERRDTGICFTWKDSAGDFREASPSVGEKLTFPSTGEIMPNFFYYAANQTIGSVEVASRFSDLSQANDHRKFIELFSKEYPWIKDMNVEVYGGSPVLFATLANGQKQPVPNVSSGINRIVAFMLAIANSTNGVVIVDEIENGIHYSHMAGIWRLLLSFARDFDCQLFISTHSQECLSALSKASGKSLDDISLWQIERGEKESSIRQFDGEDLKLALDYHEEVR